MSLEREVERWTSPQEGLWSPGGPSSGSPQRHWEALINACTVCLLPFSQLLQALTSAADGVDLGVNHVSCANFKVTCIQSLKTFRATPWGAVGIKQLYTWWAESLGQLGMLSQEVTWNTIQGFWVLESGHKLGGWYSGAFGCSVSGYHFSFPVIWG